MLLIRPSKMFFWFCFQNCLCIETKGWNKFLASLCVRNEGQHFSELTFKGLTVMITKVFLQNMATKTKKKQTPYDLRLSDFDRVTHLQLICLLSLAAGDPNWGDDLSKSRFWKKMRPPVWVSIWGGGDGLFVINMGAKLSKLRLIWLTWLRLLSGPIRIYDNHCGQTRPTQIRRKLLWKF